MKDTGLYERLLELKEPWFVQDVALNMQRQRVEVHVAHRSAERFACPSCAKMCAVYDHAPERMFRHLDTCQYQTYVHVKIPRIECSEHGVIQTELPFAQRYSRFTELFERLAIDVLQQCSVQGACRLLKLSWDEAFHLMQRAVERGRHRQAQNPMRFVSLGVDEVSYKKGHLYLTIVRSGKQVLYVAQGRDKAALAGFYDSLSSEQKAAIEAVSMDMWEPFIQATAQHLPQARRVFDPFHIVKLMNHAVDQVRRAEHAQLQAQDIEVLKKRRYLFLRAREKLSMKQQTYIQCMRKADLKTAKAWAIKEHLRRLWRCESESHAQQFYIPWHSWAMHCRIPAVVEVAKTIAAHLQGIFNYFTYRITNGPSEALNNVIQSLKKMAYGFRSFTNFQTRILFKLGRLSLYP